MTLGGGNPEVGINMHQDGDFLVIDNGVYQFRVRNYQGALSEATPLSGVPHWNGGMRVGDGPWDGRSWFDGDAPVTAVTTEVVQQGPVFIDLHITYHVRNRHRRYGPCAAAGTRQAGPYLGAEHAAA